MIAVTSSGRSFRALATYLRRGLSGEEWDRVAWTSARHLPTDEPELAATFMRATAEQSTRVTLPVYHLAISFDHADVVSRVQMEEVADAVLHRLGLSQHQALLVAHQDRTHAHVHLLVNRVHPDTGKAWERWKDRPVIEQVLREYEQRLGLRQVNGRLAPIPGREVPDRIAAHGLTSGEARSRARQASPLFVEQMRALAPALRAATTWQAWETTLAQQGLQAIPRGQGLVISDGVQYCKASRIARECSKTALERRFGLSYAARHTAPSVGSVEALAVAIRQYETATSLTRDQYAATAAQSLRQATLVTSSPQDRVAHQAAQDDARVATRHVRHLDQVRRAIPAVASLERLITQGIHQLTPEELQQLRRLLTPPQQAAAQAVHQRMRQMRRSVVLGRDDGIAR
jgi:hypothetical protein